PKHVLSGREAGRLSQIEAAEILGMSERTFRRWLPLGLLIAAVAAAYVAGVQKYLTFAAIAEHRGFLKELVAGNLLLAIAIYVLVYVATVALSLPGAAILS